MLRVIKKLVLLLLLLPVFVHVKEPIIKSDKIPEVQERFMKNKRVLISGGSVAGLTLAYWLKLYGFQPTVIERHPTLRTGGYKIDIRGVALDVIKKMGLYEALLKAKTDIKGATFVSNDGKDKKDVSADLCGGRVEGDLEVMRGDLCLILKECAGDIEYLFGDSIKAISQNENTVFVEFEKSERREFDLVIGADGLHSVVRKLVFKSEADFVKKLGIYVSVFSIPNYLHLDSWEIEYFGEKKFVNIYSMKSDVAKAGFAFAAKSEQSDPETRDEQEKLIECAFKNVGWEVPKLLSFMKDAPDFYFDYAAQIKMPSWSQGRVALVGDAAYAPSPVSGQGTSVALVGAYVLAGELAVSHGDYQKAFSEYEKQFQKFAKKNQDLVSDSVEFISATNSWRSWIKAILHKLLPVKLVEFIKARGVDRIHDAACDLQLKNYTQEMDCNYTL